MNLLRRFGGTGRWPDVLSLLHHQERPFHRREFSPLLQSRRSPPIGLLQSRRHGSSVTPPREPPCPAPAHPSWAVLERWGCPRDSTANAAAAVAESHNSSGRPLRISLALAPPPAMSFLNFEWGSRDRRRRQARAGNDDSLYVIEAHGDSALVRTRHCSDPVSDYFVYRAPAGRQPSLSLLPACGIDMYVRDYFGNEGCVSRKARYFDHMDTGLLMLRGEDDEPLVAQLQLAYAAPFNTAELCVLRPCRGWELNDAVPVVHTDGGGNHDLERWQETHAVVPVGGRFLCWVNYDLSTFLVCDMAEHESPTLRYVPLPVMPVPPKEEDDGDDYQEQPSWLYHRTIGAVGAGAVRFVSIDSRCCCGAHVVRSMCTHSSSAFMVTAWTLAVTTGGEPMAWVKECVLDCEELWELASNMGLPVPRGLEVSCPVVSLENPNVICLIGHGHEPMMTSYGRSRST
ncbi:hypothetical protein BS78_05G081700 [Paspalum vaginatum]|nr:hypothetical protein BS78_05G081700 [Paspalum vaginatum]